MSRSPASSTSSFGEGRRGRLKCTEIGWDTDDDRDLSSYMLGRRSRRKRGRPNWECDSTSYSSEDGDHDKDGGWRRRSDPACHPRAPAPAPHHHQHSPPHPRQHHVVSEDASSAKMSWRRRAMATGAFKVMIPESGRILEETDGFAASLEAFRAYGPRPRYDRYPRDVLVPREATADPRRRTRYSHVPEFPGSGKRHHVLWMGPLPGGDIRVDRMVKLYDGPSVQAYQVDDLSDGPASPRFGLVEEEDKVSFDANLFWTVGLLFKHFGTCGVQSWDWELNDMSRHYKSLGSGNNPPPPLSLPHPPPPLPTPPPTAQHQPPMFHGPPPPTPSHHQGPPGHLPPHSSGDFQPRRPQNLPPQPERQMSQASYSRPAPPPRPWSSSSSIDLGGGSGGSGGSGFIPTVVTMNGRSRPRPPPPPSTSTSSPGLPRRRDIPPLMSIKAPLSAAAAAAAPDSASMADAAGDAPNAAAGEQEEEDFYYGDQRADLGRRYTGCLTEWRGSHGYLRSTLVPGKIFLSAGKVGEGANGLAEGISVNFELASADPGTGGCRFKAIKAVAYV